MATVCASLLCGEPHMNSRDVLSQEAEGHEHSNFITICHNRGEMRRQSTGKKMNFCTATRKGAQQTGAGQCIRYLSPRV